MDRWANLAIVGAGLVIGGLALTGCVASPDVPNIPSPSPSLGEFEDGIWKVQTFGGLTMVSLLEDSGMDGQVPQYGKLVITEDGCLGLELDDRTALLVPGAGAGAVLLSPEKFEFRGETYELGDSVVLSGSGVPDGPIPAGCDSDWTLRAASMQLSPPE